ncbi:hypothetical protein, partial [Streptomyces sp. NPDC006997]|uniref:hypothetical protein n=1 Tax=Streptomyces sp. NPDC006997 TaxID=3155356 RepID=UPI0033D00A81
GGRDRKGDAVNISHQWGGPRGRWWQGEQGLFRQSFRGAERVGTAIPHPRVHKIPHVRAASTPQCAH